MCTKDIEEKSPGQVWWSPLVIPTLRRQRQKDHFELEEPVYIANFRPARNTGGPCLNPRKNVCHLMTDAYFVNCSTVLKGTF